MTSSIAVKHNIEVAHRLFELPGKCEQIHGHSMWVTMELFGEVNSKGILEGIEYGDLKRLFRGHLDDHYDHRLLLNDKDPFAGTLYLQGRNQDGTYRDNDEFILPGLRQCDGDPTTENISAWIAGAMMSLTWDKPHLTRLDVTVWETSVNMAKTSLDLVVP